MTCILSTTAGDGGDGSLPGQASDTVRASIPLHARRPGREPDTVNIGGLNGTGNDLDNVIVGNDYTNLLNGGGGVISPAGNAGDDIIDGGANADTMLVARASTISIVDDPAYAVLNYAGEGLDQGAASQRELCPHRRYSRSRGAARRPDHHGRDQSWSATSSTTSSLYRWVNTIAGGLGGLTRCEAKERRRIPVVVGRREPLEQPGHRHRLQSCGRRPPPLHQHGMLMTPWPAIKISPSSVPAAFHAPGQINWLHRRHASFIQLKRPTPRLQQRHQGDRCADRQLVLPATGRFRIGCVRSTPCRAPTMPDKDLERPTPKSRRPPSDCDGMPSQLPLAMPSQSEGGLRDLGLDALNPLAWLVPNRC